MLHADKGLEFIWVGTLLDYVPPEDRAALAKRIREEFNSVVIFLDDKVRRQWLSFCKTVLWPLLNSQLVTNKFEPALWQAYKSCNEQFAEAISKAVTGAEDEVVWIHDYHLKTLPESTRRTHLHHTHAPWRHVLQCLSLTRRSVVQSCVSEA